MRGITRPCRSQLSPELRARWRAHLCGSCLALRDTAGQAARALTGYDLLLVPALVEAQAGRLPTVHAGACPLRGMRSAEVVDPASPAARAGAAITLAAGAAGLADKLADGEVPVVLRRPSRAAAARLTASATEAAASTGVDVAVMTGARAASAAVASAFAQTAAVAGTPANAPALGRLGDAFGRLVHLLDAVDDREADRRAGRHNPLDATATSDEGAADHARRLRAAVAGSLDELDLVDGDLVRALLGPTLDAAVGRRWPALRAPRQQACVHGPASGERRPAAGAVVVGLAALTRLAMWGGRGGRGWGRRGPYGGGYDPYGPPPGYGYGYRRGFRGPSCCEMLACDCCATEACNGCCGGDGDCCVCCV
ncbi:MAG TPA: DUF5685 family protein [Acidimicrobiales bacterium]|nr:DUF5685 family protein [Acidimicrobiales bacterium]